MRQTQSNDCSVSGCGRLRGKRTGLGLCYMHYYRWRKWGDPGVDVPPRITGSVEFRFWAYVRKTPSCWEWTGYRTKNGYGRIHLGGEHRMVLAHRLAYEMLVGPVPAGLTLDHLCRNRSCVNPDHVEPVTMRENVLRGIGPTAINAAKTHCAHGHELVAVVGRGSRRCPVCSNASNVAARRRHALHEGPQHLVKTHCLRGHEFTPANTLLNRGVRRCRACAAIRIQHFRASHPGRSH